MARNVKGSEPTVPDSAPMAGGPFVVRLPAFISNEQIGLGDAVKRVTAQMGLRTCGGCERRAGTLNRWVVFTGRGPD